ncbi:MAG: trigger factor [Desulfobacteraceae bacterium]|jgi:trigger factor
MKTKLEEISSVKKKLEIEIEAGEVNKKIEEAYRELRKGVKLPGFRPGKVPRKILERRFGNQVIDDVTRRLVNETLPKAVEETKTIPLSMPIIENEILKLGQNFRYSAIMEVRPEFELKDYMGLEVEKELFSVADEDVEAQMEEIRKTHGQLSSVETERGIKEEDFAVIEYEGLEDGKALEGIKNSNFLVRVGSNDFHPDFEKALIGLKKGEMSEFNVDFEDDYSQPKLAGKSVKFNVKVIDIKEMNLPELNDDFAKNLGADFQDLDDLKDKIRETLTDREEKRVDRELKMRLLKKVSDSVDFELPESLLESELNGAMESIRQNLLRSGSNMEKAGLNEEKLKEDLRPASEKRVKDMLVLGEIARGNDLDITEAELLAGFKELALSTGQDPEALRQYYEANNLRESFRQQLLEEKTLNYLVKGANITEVEADKIKREPE